MEKSTLDLIIQILGNATVIGVAIYLAQRYISKRDDFEEKQSSINQEVLTGLKLNTQAIANIKEDVDEIKARNNLVNYPHKSRGGKKWNHG